MIITAQKTTIVGATFETAIPIDTVNSLLKAAQVNGFLLTRNFMGDRSLMV